MKLTPPNFKFPVAGAALLCLLSLATTQAEPPPPPVAITPSPAGTKVRWKPSLGSVNFLQTSSDLRTWKYHPEAVSGVSATRELDFPFAPGSQFFRAITRAYSGTDPTNEDFDGDGLLTRDEMLIFHTDPLAADSDGDGRSDGATDSDLDGIPDAAEILAGLDPHDASDAAGDSDQDGISNLAEHLAGTDPANPDTDNDTLADAWEQLYGNPKVYNDPALDTDGDGLTAKTEQLINTNPNLIDTNTNGINDGAEDADHDGISNLQEQTDGTNPADYHSGKYLSLQVLTGDAQSIVTGAQTAPITLKFTDYVTGLPAANAPIFIINTGSGSINGNSDSRVDFTTPANGEITFTYQAAADSLLGPSPLLIWLPSASLSQYKGQVALEVTAPVTVNSAARTSSGPFTSNLVSATPTTPPTASFSSLIKLASLPASAYSDYFLPQLINSVGQVAFNSNQMVVWDGSSLRTLGFPGQFQISDLNSNGDLVGSYNFSTSQAGEHAFHVNINYPSPYIVPPSIPLLYRYYHDESKFQYFPYTVYHDSIVKSRVYGYTKFTAVDEKGIAYGMYDSIVKYLLPDEVNFHPGIDFDHRFSNQSGDIALHTPASFSLKSRSWSSIYGGFPKSYLYSDLGVPTLHPWSDVGPHCVSPDGSKLIFGETKTGAIRGGIHTSPSYQLPEARPYLGPLAKLPAPIIAVNDTGVIVGSFVLDSYYNFYAHPFVYAKKKLVYLTPQDEVLGVSNLGTDKPMTIIGALGIWRQKVVATTGVPVDLAKGSKAFEYKTYAQLDPNNLIGLTHLTATCVSKDGTTLALTGTDTGGLTQIITAFLGGVAVDMDRNGKIEYGKDHTTSLKPYNFWLNDDRDIGHSIDQIVHAPNADWEEDDVNADEQASVDSDMPGLNFMRDLEDLTRIWIDFSVLSKIYPTSDPTVSLKVRMESYVGTPKVNLFQPVESDGGREYLKDFAIGYQQIHGIYAMELCKVTGPTSVEIPRRAWEKLPSDKTIHLLFEGSNLGNGRLIFELWKNDQKVLDLPPVHLALSSAKSYYETWTVGDSTIPESIVSADHYAFWPATVATPKLGTGLSLTTPVKPEEKDYIMFVHGWNMSPDDKTQFADTMYKRLWHQGFKGRFGAYRWPTFYTSTVGLNNFNGSEERAWNAAAPLANLIQERSLIFNVDGTSKVRIFGHSMGNIVCSEALRTFGPSAPVQAYISGQAAVAAHCWDSRTVAAGGPRLMDFTLGLSGSYLSNTANIYRSYWQPAAGTDAPHKWEIDGRPSYMSSSYMPGNVKYVNHYNIDDWALVKWELNQKVKPSFNYNYGWVPGTALSSSSNFYKNLLPPIPLLCPADRFQIFSWASEARSYATGAEPATRGLFTDRVNLSAPPYNFDGMHKGHSAQFRSTIQKRWIYWNQFIKDCEIP
jgi:Alpha/beta hydrolase of unknown function (DUF900)/Bacterial TSP3 repeat